MNFLGIKGSTWKNVGKTVGKYALKAAPIAAAFIPGVGPLAALGIRAGLGAASGAAGGGGLKGALLGGGLSAIPGGGVAGGAAGTAAKVGLKEIAKGVGKGAITNFATTTGTNLALGQGVKNSLAAGGQGALAGGTGGAGGFKQTAKQIGKTVATNVGGTLASKGLQQAGVPGAIAGQGGNVFSNYLGNQFTGSPSGSSSPPGVRDFLGPQPQPAPGAKPTSAGINSFLPKGGWQGVLGDVITGVGQRVGGGASTAPTTPGGGGTRSTGPTYPNGPTQQAPQTWENAPTTPPPDGERPASWKERWGSVIAQGVGLGAGALVGQQATKMAQKRSPEEQAALAGAQGAAGQLGQLGGQMAREGQDYRQKPGQYFQTLLGGNRAAMSQAVAAPTAQITSNYRGAERALTQSGVRGAARDQAVTDLNRQRASQVAGLTTGMQPYAAEQLAKMGQETSQTGMGALIGSGNIYGNLLGQGFNNRTYARSEGERAAAAAGGLAREVGEVVFKGPQKPGTPAPKDAKKKTAGGTPESTPAATPEQTQPSPDWNRPLPTPTWTGAPNRTPPGYPTFEAPGDYDPNKAWT